MSIDLANLHRKPADDPDAPSQDDMASWVRKNEHERVREAFERFELPTTHLLHEARSGAMVDLLVSNGADVDEVRHYEHSIPAFSRAYTPLQMASSWWRDDDRKEVFDRLLAHGADFEIGGDRRPLMRALSTEVGKGSVGYDMADALLDRGARVHAEPGEKPVLLHAVQNGYGEALIKRLLEAGADPQQGFENEGAPLHHVWDQVGVLHLLVDYGANVNDPLGDNRTTPLERAVRKGYTDITEALLARGADYKALVQKPDWEDLVRNPNIPNFPNYSQRAIEAVQKVENIDKERAALRQVAAEATQEQAPDIAEAPAPRRRMRL